MIAGNADPVGGIGLRPHRASLADRAAGLLSLPAALVYWERGVVVSRQPAELGWVLRPNMSAPHAAGLAAHAGKRVHSFQPLGEDDLVDVVLHDGARVRATRAEVVTG